LVLSWDELLLKARAFGYDGPDEPLSDEDDVALAAALWRAASAARERREWVGIPMGARELIYLVLVERLPLESS
jgi:hypothetical protein